MIDSGIEANTVCYNSVINAWARAGDVEKAEVWLTKLAESKGKASANTYNILLNACARAGDVEKAEAWLEKMRTVAGVEPDVISYTTVISLYAKSCAVSKAEKLMDNMCAAGVKPNDVCFNSMIDVYAKSGNI